MDFERRRVRAQLRAQLFGTELEPTRLGRYEVVERIGAGATSCVYLGIDTKLDRRVALKLLRREGDREGWRERFIREGRALASLSHPNVLQVYEIGTDGEEVYLAIELIEGRDLGAWLNEARRSWQDVVAVMVDAAAGLGAAHDHGLVHRDIKPANVLVDADGRVRVADFGLVQPPGKEERSPPPSDRAPSSLTRTGALVGSPAYMSPEQWSGESVDARSDQFGLCVMFFEALHGRRPFVAQSEAELADLVMRGAIQPASDAERAERPVPDWLDEIVLRGLSPDPATRFPDMHDLVDTLTRCASCARHLTDARDALHQARRQQSSFPAHAAVASVAISNALDARPDSDDARAVRAELLESWFAYDLGQGALDAAAAHLAGLPGRSDLQQLLSDARASAAEQSERLAKLSELERDADPSVGLNVKVRILLVQAPLWALVFWGLGAATRQGWLHAGHFAAIFVAHIVSTVLAVRAQPEIWMPNRVARRVIELSVTNQLGTVLMMLYAWFAGVDLATAFLFVQLMLTAFWLGAGLVMDRGMFFVAGVAFAAAVFMHYVPAYAVDAYGVATAIALVGLALSWARGGKRRED